MISEIGETGQSAHRARTRTRMPNFACRIISLMYD